MNNRFLVALLGWLLGGLAPTADAARAPRPNIIFLLADDLGYGDVNCNNPAGKIATPNLDRLAAAGMRFTDAHTTSSVCTPTRYSLLTGRYNWRSRLQSGVLGGLSPRLIEPGRLTVAALLQQHGYHTAAVGKWHLGLDWVKFKDQPAPELNDIEKSNQVWSVDFTQPIAGGPNSVGFEYYFGIAASLDMVPYTFIENNRVTIVPTVNRSFPMTAGKARGQTRRGPSAPDFEAEQVLPTLTRKAVDYVASRAAEAKAGKPFFLYVPFASPHTPIAPTEKFRGKSGLSPYADFVMETDWAVGEILAALDRHRFADNTLVFFASDNGCSPAAEIAELRAAGHEPNGPWRGTKADIWDGGHRVPFLACWPGQVKPGTTSDQLISLVDLMATCADIIGVRLPDHAGEDSVSFLPALQGRAEMPLREALVHHSINGKFAIRQGQWKLELCPGSGGWSAPRDLPAEKQGLPAIQLYDMAADRAEAMNLQAEHPEVVARLTKLLEKYVADGRSTPGQPQPNDGQIDLWKKTKPQSKKP
ncbi:MAG: arylsulfatase [Verrucomicrobia bacterium]|nr:arylsulfatase [Verrucomicrobiota bacterium]